MKHTDAPKSAGAKNDKFLRALSTEDRVSWVWFFLLLLIYISVSVFVNKIARSEGTLVVSGRAIPYRSLTGALSSAANVCLILLVIFFKKQGFIVSMVLLIAQFPILLIQVLRQNYSVIAGFFSNILIIYAVCLIFFSTDKLEKTFRYQATTDQLTGLPNRFACTELIESLIKHWQPFALAIVNLNNFKSINSTMGQAVGDAVLCAIASRWRDAMEKGVTGTDDYISCQGGDEFAIIIRRYTSRGTSSAA